MATIHRLYACAGRWLVVSRARVLRRMLPVFLIACSNEHGALISPVDPHNSDGAVARLSSEVRSQFENWKIKPLKNCDAAEALGFKTAISNQSNLDPGALINANSQSLVLRDGSDFAVVNGFEDLTGELRSEIIRSIDIDGRRSAINARAIREGSRCVIFLDGQNVFETTLVGNALIGAQSIGPLSTQASDGHPTLLGVGKNEYSEITDPALVSIIEERLRPTGAAIDLIAKKLSAPRADIERIFLIRPQLRSVVSLITNPAPDASVVWNDLSVGHLTATTKALTKVVNEDSSFKIRTAFSLPIFNFALSTRSITNSKDIGVSEIQFNFKIARGADAHSSKLIYHLASVLDLGARPIDLAEARSCTNERLKAYALVTRSAGGSVRVEPSVQNFLGPCRIFDPRAEEVAVIDGYLKSIIPIIFSGVLPSATNQYGGWDQLLARLVVEQDAAGIEARRDLDPEKRTIILPAVDSYLARLIPLIERNPGLNRFRESLIRAVVRWAVDGQTVTISRMERILHALDVAVEPFQSSTERLLLGLTQQPNFNDEALSYAEQLTDEFKSAARAALSVATDLGFDEFRREVFNQVIQRNVGLQELRNWRDRMENVRAILMPYTKLKSFKEPLVGLSLKWKRSREVRDDEAREVYDAFENVGDAFPESARRLLEDLQQSYQTNRAAVEYARRLTSQDVSLILSVARAAETAKFTGWSQHFLATILQNRPDSAQLGVFSNMWRAILSFNEREASRVKDEIGSTNEWSRQKIIETAVRENWDDSEFISLETIAPLAQIKSGCERYRGLSQLAECGNINLFSKQKLMFLDPLRDGVYRQLAAQLRSIMTTSMTTSTDVDFGSINIFLAREFFGGSTPPWSSCGNDQIIEKGRDLIWLLTLIIRERDQFKNLELERTLITTFQDCH